MKDNKWIQKAIKPENKGALRKKLGIKKGKTIPLSELKKSQKSKSATTRKQANLAITLKKLKNK